MIYYFYLGVLTISFLFSLTGFRHHPAHLKLFSLLLGLSVLTETLAALAVPVFHGASNHPVYNIFMLVEYPLYATFFLQLTSSRRTREGIRIFLLTFPLAWLATTLFIFGLGRWNSYMIIFGDAGVIGMCIRYFYELFVSEELFDLRKLPEFWIAAGTMAYSCCELPITGILNFLTSNYERQALWLENALQILNIFMYLVIIYAYLCRRLTNTMKSL